MTFSYTAVWNDTVALLRANASLIAAIAGVFIFFPQLLLAYFLPAPQSGDPQARIDYFSSNFHWFLLAQLVSMVGSIAILTLLFRRDGVSVGEAIGNGFALLPFYFLAFLASGFIVGVGFLALIVPGLYLIGRLAPVGPLVVDRKLRNPFTVIGRAFQLTKGRGWAVFGLMFLVWIAAVVLMMAVGAVFGIMAVLAGDVGRLLAMIVSSAAAAAFGVVMILLMAAIYRALAGAAPSALDQR